MNLISRDELIELLIEEGAISETMAIMQADALLRIGHFERHEFVPTVQLNYSVAHTYTEKDWTMQCKCGKEEPHDGK